jgi:hypothetical protein
MEISSVQGGTQTPNYQQQQVKQAQQTPEQQTAVMREATVDSSAALQVYKQQSREQSAPVDTVQIKSTSTLKNLDTVKAIEQMHAKLNDLVKGVRQSNEALNNAADQVAAMHGSAMAIIKNYPPYPIESMERRDLLMSYASVRKEIEKMMIPAPPQPVYEKVRSMWDAMFSSNGQILASAVPALDAGSGDKQVQEAASQLGKLGEQFSALSDAVTQSLLNA